MLTGRTLYSRSSSLSPSKTRNGNPMHDAVIDKFADACSRFSFERDGVLLAVSQCAPICYEVLQYFKYLGF